MHNFLFTLYKDDGSQGFGDCSIQNQSARTTILVMKDLQDYEECKKGLRQCSNRKHPRFIGIGRFNHDVYVPHLDVKIGAITIFFSETVGLDDLCDVSDTRLRVLFSRDTDRVSDYYYLVGDKTKVESHYVEDCTCYVVGSVKVAEALGVHGTSQWTTQQAINALCNRHAQ